MPALAFEFIFDEKLLYYLKLYMVMYADDTVVLAESEDEMQKSLNTLHEYCVEWKLKICDENKEYDILPWKNKTLTGFIVWKL